MRAPYANTFVFTTIATMEFSWWRKMTFERPEHTLLCVVIKDEKSRFWWNKFISFSISRSFALDLSAFHPLTFVNCIMYNVYVCLYVHIFMRSVLPNRIWWQSALKLRSAICWCSIAFPFLWRLRKLKRVDHDYLTWCTLVHWNQFVRLCVINIDLTFMWHSA